jgi:transcriptional regulator with XRE-family HTH domain
MIDWKGVIEMLTAFGIALRKLRLDCGEILKTMADKLEISSSYLSAIEVGKRNVPEDFISRLSALYHLDAEKIRELEAAKLESQKEVAFGLGNAPFGKREAALLFARKFDDLDEQMAEKIKLLINNSAKGG